MITKLAQKLRDKGFDKQADLLVSIYQDYRIVSAKKKIKFDPDFSEKELRHYVKHRADHIPETGFGEGRLKDFKWTYKPKFELSKLSPIKKDWKAWYEGELDEWVYDHGDERKGHFEKWAKDPETKPLVVVEGTDGKLHIWDGHHRCGMAHIKEMETVPVVYGIRKDKQDPKIDQINP